MSEDEVGLSGTCPSKNNFKGDSSDLAVDSDIECLLEDLDGGWQSKSWSPDNLSSQEDDQDARVITDNDYDFSVIEYDSDVVHF
jgi:hypothetical protein